MAHSERFSSIASENQSGHILTDWIVCYGPVQGVIIISLYYASALVCSCIPSDMSTKHADMGIAPTSLPIF